MDKHIGNYRILIIHGFMFRWVDLMKPDSERWWFYNRIISWDGGCFHAVSWGFNEELRGKERIGNQPKNRYYDRSWLISCIYLIQNNNLTIYHTDL
jgi:hypothetical protein